ncbi:MAG: peptide chain release factor 1 [Bacteroidota bacterium]
MSNALTPDLRDALIAELEERTTAPGFHYLDANHLTDLAAIESASAPVLSLFMSLTPEMRIGDGWQIAFKDIARRALEHADGQYDRATVQNELSHIEEALRRGIPRTGRGLAFYACEALGLFRQFGLAIDIPSTAYVDRRPYVRPLVRVRDEHDRFGIAVLSQKQMRFFFSQIGLVEEVFELEGREILTTDFQTKDQRQDKQAEYRKEQAKRAAHALQLLANKLDVRHLVYSSPADMEAPFLDALEQHTRDRIAASFQCEINASTAEIAEKAEPIQREVEEKEELETLEQVQALLTTKAVAGIEDTLDMLNQQRVMTLLLDDEQQIPGGIDRETGMLTSQTEGTLEATGNEVFPQSDLFELMLERALEQGASLELVRSEAARARMQDLGPAAALLRF